MPPVKPSAKQRGKHENPESDLPRWRNSWTIRTPQSNLPLLHGSLLGVVFLRWKAARLRMDSQGWGSSNNSGRHAHVSLLGKPRPYLEIIPSTRGGNSPILFCSLSIDFCDILFTNLLLPFKGFNLPLHRVGTFHWNNINIDCLFRPLHME